MRHTLIKSLLSDLPDISSVVIKYDYYLEGKITTKLHLNTNNDSITNTLVIPKINKVVYVSNDSDYLLDETIVKAKLVVWDLLDKTNITFELKTPIDQIELLPNGRMISCDGKGDLQIWDFRELYVPDIIIECKPSYMWSIFTVLNNGNIATTWCDNKDVDIKIWSNTVNIMTLKGHTDYIKCLIESGNRLISASRDGTIRIWNLSIGICEHIIKEDVTYLLALPRSDPSDKFISRSIDGILNIRNTLTGECKNTSNYKSYGRIIIWENNIITCSCNDIIIWDTLNENTITLGGHTDYILDIFILPDGTLLSISKDNTMRIWDLQNNTCIIIWPTPIYRDFITWLSAEYRGYITIWNNKIIIDNQHEVVVWE